MRQEWRSIYSRTIRRYLAFAPGRDVGAFVVVNRIDFGMFGGLTEGVNELIAMLAVR
jgi:D-alanyl-D-alanine-carboxypeptidase/D-alanyl-D-alanine-endopeptidase